jgi:2-methylcitrate dehydratase PrpD
MTLSQQLISLIRTKDVSASDTHRAAILTLDAIANAMAGRNTEPGRKLLAWGRQQGSDAGRQAFVIGGLTHILETDDLHRSSVTHPGCVVVPAVIAAAITESVTGPDILKAVLHGYEAMCRIGNAVGPTHYQVWHNTATCGPYGSAMAMASLKGLSDAQAMHALGNAGTQSSGVWEFLDTGAMSKHLHAGRAAESGMIAVDLAALDFTGPPKILEGDKGFFAAACPDAIPSAVTADTQGPWELTRTSTKPWPSCRHTHPAIDAALQLHGQLNGAEIERVNVETYQAALDVCDRPLPASEYEAKFSLYHTVAVALQNGCIQFQSFDAETRKEMADLRQIISIAAAEPWVSAYPESWGARVSVTTKKGSEHIAERDGARGDPENALDDQEMLEKARTLLEYGGCDQADSKRIIEGIMSLPNGGSDIAVFLRHQFT